MPRGRARGYELQRETILARAAELFAQHGYTATSMNQVAEACGVSKPSLYHYVRDKHQLLAEIAETHVTRLLALIRLKLNNREMAGMLGITVEGVKKAKQRLRKKQACTRKRV